MPMASATDPFQIFFTKTNSCQIRAAQIPGWSRSKSFQPASLLSDAENLLSTAMSYNTSYAANNVGHVNADRNQPLNSNFEDYVDVDLNTPDDHYNLI
jgi:hypothetical protein